VRVVGHRNRSTVPSPGTTWVFGFASNGPGKQRLGGFGQGMWQFRSEREFYDAIKERYLTVRVPR
jgi:hypothetical protein